MKIGKAIFCASVQVVLIDLVFAVHELRSKDRDKYAVCPKWSFPTSNVSCKCGDSLNGVVKCDEQDPHKLSILVCYCISFSDVFNTTVVGLCPFNCYFISNVYTEFKICTHYRLKRTGMMCSRCLPGYTPPVYSYSLGCVKCTDYKYNWLKYIAVAFLPLTVFYIVVIVFRITVTSGAMNGYILVTQIIAAPVHLRLLTIHSKQHFASYIVHAIATANMLWNLDFFRSVYHPFCLHPNMTTLQTFALEYTVAVYPLLLIIVTYIFVKLHDRYSVIVRLWRPFYWCFARIRREWNIHSSLIGAFATFLLLGYVKIINISFDLLTPVALYDVHGNKMPKLFLYYDGTYEYFGKDHLPYAFLALFMLFVFNIIPLVLLCLYPCRCFHKVMNCCGLRCQVLHVFMDTFHGCYRLNPHDYRHFAAFYLLFRIIYVAMFALTTSPLYFPFSGLMFLSAAMMVALVRPYKTQAHNWINACLFALLAVMGLGLLSFCYLAEIDPNQVKRKWHVYMYPIVMLPTVYGVGLFIYSVIPKTLYTKLKALAHHCSLKFKQNVTENEEEPYRLEHSDEYTPLLVHTQEELQQTY